MAHTKVTKTYSQNTGAANTFSYSGSFDTFKESEVVVELDNVALTYTTSTINNSASPREYTVDYTAKTITIGGDALTSGTVVIKPVTDLGSPTPRATYSPGSSVTAEDLNNNQTQLLRRAMEYEEQVMFKTGGVMTGTLEMGEDQVIKFEGATANDHEITLTVADPSSDTTITLPNTTGTVVTTGDSQTVNSTMITNGTIVNGDVNSNAEIEVSKLQDGAARQVLQTASDGSSVAWTSDVDLPGTLDVTGASTLDSTLNVAGTTTAVAINASGAVGVDGNFDVNTDKFTVASSSGNTTVAGTLGVTGLSTLASVDINGGAVDGTTIGASSAAAGTFTTVNASGTITGDVTGDLTGNADTATDLAAAAKITNSEQGSHSVNDTTYFTTSASDARYYNIGTTEEIVSGETWVGDDAKVATTKAIDNRIVDILDDVGGFIPITDEGELPQYHPEKENVTTSDRVGTILSIGTLTTTYTPSAGTCTIQASDLTNHSVNATITDCGSTVLTAGFGVLVETTAQNDVQYAAGPSFKFHRLVPKATEVTTVAGKATEITTCHTNITNINTVASDITDINAVAADATDIGAVAAKATEIGRLGTAAAVEDLGILGTAAIVEDMSLLGTTACVADMALLGDSAVIADMATIADTSNLITNIGTVAGIDTEITTVAGIQAAVSTTASNSTNVSNFANTYQIASSAPSTDGGGNALAAGDLYFDTSASELKVRNAANNAWQGGVTATGNLVAKNGDEFTGNVGIPDGSTSAPSLYNVGDTNTGIYFGAADEVDVTAGGTTRLEINSDGIDVTGNITVSGNVDGKDVSTLIANVSEDTTPQLGGNLDCLDKLITTTNSDQEIDIRSTGTGRVSIHGGTTGRTKLHGNSGGFAVLTTHSTTDLLLDTNDGTNTGTIKIEDGVNGDILLTPNGTGDVILDGLKYPQADGNAGEFLKTNGSAQLSWAAVATVGGATGVAFNDDVKAGFGAGNSAAGDLQIFHDYSGNRGDAGHNKIESVGAHLDIQCNNDIQITTPSTSNSGADSPEVMAKFHTNGECQLNYNGNEKFETTNTGTNTTGVHVDDGATHDGDVTFTGANYNALWDKAASKFKFNNNSYASFGTGDELIIYHNGTDTYLTNDTGDLWIQNTGTNADDILIKAKDDIFLQPQDGENGVNIHGGGSVELHHANIKTFETDTNGNIVAADKHLQFTNGTWTGEVAGKIQLSGNLLYIQGGSSGIQFRSHDGSGWGGWNIDSNGHFIPANNNTMDIGSSSNRVRNIYTNDLNLSNEGSTNDVDGTWGSFTMQEGEDDLFLINKRNGKKYKFNLTEVN